LFFGWLTKKDSKNLEININLTLSFFNANLHFSIKKMSADDFLVIDGRSSLQAFNCFKLSALGF
jgi:hypothetical protein